MYIRVVCWLQMLIQAGMSVNVRDTEGMSPSMWACRMDHIEHFELLSRVENQDIPEEDQFERDHSGKTWMHHSVRRTEPLECLRVRTQHYNTAYKYGSFISSNVYILY